MRQTADKPYSRIKWETIRRTYDPKMIQTMHTLSARLKDEFTQSKCGANHSPQSQNVSRCSLQLSSQIQ